MALQRRGRFIVAIIILVLIGIFLPPWINVGRYRSSIASSIERAIGRKTTIDHVQLRLLPQPGFDLQGVTIADDPAFGPEPMLRADQVRATLRLSSLWRGRPEIAKLTLQYPSLNLVRASNGSWNIENLLEHASRIPTAPTTKTRPESRPRFPYIEAEGGRINFKIGMEKKVYSLADADFALWMASENEARTRLAARMVRTDSYLSDTGTVKFEGRFQRAWNLRDTPMTVTASIENAQLGQLTKLIDGLDRGWRGAVDADISLNGTPSDLKLAARAGITDFRRYDVASVDRVRLQTECSARFSSTNDRLSDIACNVPMSDGNFGVHGSIDGILDLRAYDLSLTATKVPLQQLALVVRHTKKDVPEDINVSGDMNAAFTFIKPSSEKPAIWAGSGKTSDLALTASTLNTPLTLKPIEFAMQPPQIPTQIPSRSQPVWESRLSISPIALPAGAAEPATLSGWFNQHDYAFTLAGDADLPRILQLAKTAGLRPPDVNADGSAKLDLTVSGRWVDMAPPKPAGTIQLRAVNARIKSIAAPLQLTSATLSLTNDAINVSNISASFADSHLALSGSAKLPRHCESLPACEIQFDLRSDQVSTDELNRLFNPHAARRPWYAILGSSPAPSIFLSLNATGNLTIARLNLKSLTANKLSTSARLQNGKLVLADIRAEILGGKHRGEWTADFTTAQPQYSGTGNLDSVALAQLGSLMKDNWATGAVSGTYTASLRGLTEQDLLSSASGDLNFDWRKGVLRHISLNGSSAPLNFARMTGTLSLHNGLLTVAPETTLATDKARFQLSGKAAPELALKLQNASQSFTVTGTLEKPKVAATPVSEAKATLKP